MANSSVCPSPRTVPAHAGAAHAARRVTPVLSQHVAPTGTPRQAQASHGTMDGDPLVNSLRVLLSTRGYVQKGVCAMGYPGPKFSLCMWCF